MQLSQKFDTLEHVLKQSGLEVALGRNALFFKSDLAFDKKEPARDHELSEFEVVLAPERHALRTVVIFDGHAPPRAAVLSNFVLGLCDHPSK